MFTNELAEHVFSLFEATVSIGLDYMRSGKFELVPTVDNQIITSLCSLFVSLLPKVSSRLPSPRHRLCNPSHGPHLRDALFTSSLCIHLYSPRPYTVDARRSLLTE